MNFHTLSTIHKIQPFGHVFTIQGELEAKQNKTKQKTGTVSFNPVSPGPSTVTGTQQSQCSMNICSFIYQFSSSKKVLKCPRLSLEMNSIFLKHMGEPV